MLSPHSRDNHEIVHMATMDTISLKGKEMEHAQHGPHMPTMAPTKRVWTPNGLHGGTFQESSSVGNCPQVYATGNFRRWWPGTESNRRRQPFQGWIRPELSHSKQRMKAASMSRKPPTYWDKSGTRFWPVKIASPLLSRPVFLLLAASYTQGTLAHTMTDPTTNKPDTYNSDLPLPTPSK